MPTPAAMPIPILVACDNRSIRDRFGLAFGISSEDPASTMAEGVEALAGVGEVSFQRSAVSVSARASAEASSWESNLVWVGGGQWTVGGG